MVNDVCYEIGSHSIDITSPLSIPYLAGNPRHQVFSAVHDPIYASVSVVSDGSNEIALVAIDGIGINNNILGEDRNITNEIKERIQLVTGIRKNSVLVFSGHIHSTPDTTNFRPITKYPDFNPWLESVMEKIGSAAQAAVKSKFKAQLKIGKGKAEGISMNRRKGECLDTEVIVLLFEAINKETNVILVNFACHPVIVQAQELVSSDYVGAMRDILRAGLKGISDVLFIQGACGDINPRRGWTCNFRDVYLTGAVLAGEVMKIYGLLAAPDYPIEPVKVNSIAETVELPSRQLPTPEEIEKLIKEVEELQPKYENASTVSERDLLNEQLGQKEEAYWRIKEGDKPYKAEIQLVRIGNSVLTGIPGEPLCEMGLKIKEMFKPLVSIPTGYANGYLGYIASKAEWEKGGYEVDLGPWAKVGPEAYEQILETIMTLMENMKDS